MAAGADGEGTLAETHLTSQVDGTEERDRSTPTAAKVKKERVVLETDCGPRPEQECRTRAREWWQR